MIFFVIDGTQRADYTPVTDPAAFAPVFPTHPQPLLVSWSEVYPLTDAADPLQALRAAVWAAAATDDHCTAMAERAETLFGIQSLTAGPPWWERVVAESLEYWAHPWIGNISADWDAAPQRPLGDENYRLNWESATFLDAASKTAIQDLAATLPQPRRSARDQVRICHNIVDLARAFVGEMTSYIPKRLEKLYALELCQSASLQADLVELLTAAAPRHTVPEAFAFRDSEYCGYYLGDLLQDLDAAPDGTQAYMLRRLLAGYTGQPPPPDPPASGNPALWNRVAAVWAKLPPVAQGAILLNDLRRVVPPRGSAITGKRATRLLTDTTYGFDTQSGAIPYSIRNAWSSRSGWRFTDKWTRDERHPATRTPRRLLVPTWAGPSEHVSKNLANYRAVLDTDYPLSADASIPAALFAFWRLYYDRRYSPSHTLVETCEGTIFNVDVSHVRRPLVQDAALAQGEAYGLFDVATVAARRPRSGVAANERIHPIIDGLAIMELLRHRYGGTGRDGVMDQAAIDDLGVQLDAQRTALADDGRVVVPRWSHEMTPTTTGTAVATFRPPADPVRRRRRNKAAKAPVDV